MCNLSSVIESACDVERGNSRSAREVIEHALDSLGFKNAGNVRVGKYMEVDVKETDKAKADAAVKAMCEKLLANTIVEEYRYELTT